MTAIYTNADDKYLEQRKALANQRAVGINQEPPKPEIPPMEEVPDMNEAERIWRLLVDSATGG